MTSICQIYKSWERGFKWKGFRYLEPFENEGSCENKNICVLNLPIIKAYEYVRFFPPPNFVAERPFDVESMIVLAQMVQSLCATYFNINCILPSSVLMCVCRMVIKTKSRLVR